jgi:hypothetical protein
MSSPTIRRAALTARDAHDALLELKKLVDNATEKIRTAELEMVGMAIGRSKVQQDPSRALRAAAQSLQSPALDDAISHARAKMNDAVALQLGMAKSTAA